MSLKTMKIYFILPNIGAGGAQRIVSFLVTMMDKKKFDTQLIVLGNQANSVFDIEGVDVRYLEKTRLLNAIPTLFKILKKEQPDLVFSSIGHINIILGLFSFYFRKIKFIVREASVLSKRMEFSSFNTSLFNFLIKLSYKGIEKIVCQSKDMRDDFVTNFNIAPHKLIVINNPITKEIPFEAREQLGSLVKFVTVGRLSEEKGHIRLLECLSKIEDYKFSYTIIGSGHCEQQIKEKAKSLNLEDKICYISFTNEVLNELKKYDYFLQGSFVEGFPNALLESCLVGTPVIAFNVLGGTKEIVESGVNGYLVENEDEFVSTLKDLNKLKNIQKTEAVNLSVKEKFKSQKIMKDYEELFTKTVQ
ncbi:glycosyltransferase [Flavicella sediminum]|uniref:glycosyltransferase n=1 Tax=Flavicella sediminum TaxID=2585141 RepID=UPI0011210CFB|nr:glycosyltransferase [Flavicella sediminum]